MIAIQVLNSLVYGALLMIMASGLVLVFLILTLLLCLIAKHNGRYPVLAKFLLTVSQ